MSEEYTQLVCNNCQSKKFKIYFTGRQHMLRCVECKHRFVLDDILGKPICIMVKEGDKDG